MSVPQELRYTSDHEWVATGDDGVVRVGITDYAQDQLGDVIFADLPAADTRLSAGDTFGEVESTKSVSELFTPVAGEVVRANSAVTESPELINSDPYGEGWLIEIRPDDAGDLDELLDASAYRALIAQ